MLANGKWDLIRQPKGLTSGQTACQLDDDDDDDNDDNNNNNNDGGVIVMLYTASNSF